MASKENMLIIDNSGKGLKKLDRPEVNESTAQCTTLILDKNGLSKVDHLEVYPHLQQLSIANNRLVRMNGVSKLRTLRVLNMPNNSIQSIEGLRELLELEWLNLSGNSLKNVEHLATNLKLRYLDLSDNSISIISDISMLKQLKTLLLHGNILTTLRSFPAYIPTSLDILSLAENEISDLAEVSYLSCLSQLKQLSVMNNPCVMFAASSMSSHGGFDYRPFVVNWCLTLEILDGNAITQKESLRAEWLYSQGKGRKFYPGQHFQLAEYLSQTCPLTTASELQSKDDERLLKVLKQQKKHRHDLHTGHTPRQTPTTPQPTPSPSSPSRPESTRPSSSRKPVKSPGVSKPRQGATTPLRSPAVNSPPSPPYTDTSPQKAPSKAWHSTSGGRKEPVLHKNFQPGGKGSTTAVDLLLQDVDESVTENVLDSISVHLPVDSSGRPDQLILPRISPGSRVRAHTYDGTTVSTDTSHLPSFGMEDVEEDSDSQSSSSFSQYDMYENRPLKPPQQVKSYLEQLSVDDDSYSERDTPTLDTDKQDHYERTDRGTIANQRANQKQKPKPKHRGGSKVHEDELRHIKDVAKTKKRLKRAVTPDAGRTEAKGHEAKQRARKLSVPDDPGSAFDKDHAATKIQALWRGLHAREKDESILNIHETLKSQRMDDHVQFLTMELERTRQLYEQEKHLRVLQMEALKLLWNQVKTLQEWKHSVDSANNKENSRLHQDEESSPEMESEEHSDLSQEHLGVSQEHHPDLARQREQQLEQTCDHLQKQVSRLQESLDQISSYIATSQIPSSTLLSSQSKEKEIKPSSEIVSHLETETNTTEESKNVSITTPKNVAVSCRSSTSVSIKWEPSHSVDENGCAAGESVSGYRLHIDLRGNKWIMEVPGTQTSLGGLVPGTYKFAVSAFTSELASSLSPWVEINLPQSPADDSDQTLHNPERERPQSDNVSEAESKSRSVASHRNDANARLHQEEFNVGDNMQRSKVTGDKTSTSSEDDNGVAMAEDQQHRPDGRREVVSNVAREMSLEIIESLLNSVLMESQQGPSVSSQSSPLEESRPKGPIPMLSINQDSESIQLKQNFSTESENSLLQSVVLDSDSEENGDRFQTKKLFSNTGGNLPEANHKESSVRCESRRVDSRGKGMMMTTMAQKKSNQTKIAATFNLSDSYNDSEGSEEITEICKKVGHLIAQGTHKSKTDDYQGWSRGGVTDGTFGTLLPIEKLIQSETSYREKEVDDVFGGSEEEGEEVGSWRPDPDQTQLRQNQPKKGVIPAARQKTKNGEHKRTLPAPHPSNLQSPQHYSRTRAKSNSSAKTESTSEAAACKGKISRGKYHQPRKGAGLRNFGVRRSGSEPNLSLMQDRHSGSKQILSPNGRSENDPQRSNLRRSSGGASGLKKSGIARNDMEQTSGQRRESKEQHPVKGQTSLGKFKTKRSPGSIIPALISPGFHYPSNSSKLPVKHLKNRGAGTGKFQGKSSEKPVVHRGKNSATTRTGVDGAVDVNMNENGNNCNPAANEVTGSWETVSSGEADRDVKRV